MKLPDTNTWLALSLSKCSLIQLLGQEGEHPDA